MTKQQNGIYIIYAALILTLMTDRFSVLYSAFIIAIFIYVSIKNKNIIKTNDFVKLIAGIALVIAIDTAIYILPGISPIFSFSVAFKEFVRCALYILIFLTISTFSINIKAYFCIWSILTFGCVAIAAMQFYDIFNVNEYIIDIYGNSLQLYNTQFDTLERFRSGSVFLNPNVFAGYLLGSFSIFLFAARNLRLNIVVKILLFAVHIAGLLFCGSRTGFIIATLLTVRDMFVSNKGKQGKLLVVLLIIPIAYMLFSILNEKFNISEFRIFSISSGISTSFDYKLKAFLTAIKNMNLIHILIGYGPFDYSKFLMDSDIGYFIGYFGLAGIYLYYNFIKVVKNTANVYLPERRIFNISFCIIVVLFGLTAGMYFNIRVFSLFLIMLSPSVYKEERQLL